MRDIFLFNCWRQRLKTIAKQDLREKKLSTRSKSIVISFEKKQTKYLSFDIICSNIYCCTFLNQFNFCFGQKSSAAGKSIKLKMENEFFTFSPIPRLFPSLSTKRDKKSNCNSERHHNLLELWNQMKIFSTRWDKKKCEEKYYGNWLCFLFFSFHNSVVDKTNMKKRKLLNKTFFWQFNMIKFFCFESHRK